MCVLSLPRLPQGTEVSFETFLEVRPKYHDCVAVVRLLVVWPESGGTGQGWVSVTGRTHEDQNPIVHVVRWPETSPREANRYAECVRCGGVIVHTTRGGFVFIVLFPWLHFPPHRLWDR